MTHRIPSPGIRTTSVEAGLGLDAVISRVATELRMSHPDLANELALNFAGNPGR